MTTKIKNFFIIAFVIVIIITTYIVVSGFTSNNQCGPFSTSEWRQCHEECSSSMSLNLEKVGFSKEEIKKMDINIKCIEFCQESLYKKREKAGCYK
jgi:hypothetical protein